MLAQESFNTITNKIEEIISSRPRDYQGDSPNPKEIGQLAFEAGECSYIDDRSRNEIFKFITGMTLTQYINYRLMMYSYKVLLEQENYDLNELINILGLSGEPALYKKFKETFHMTPKEAYERKIWSLYVSPSSWETTSTEGHSMFIKTIEVIKEVPVEVIKEVEVPIRNRRIAIIAILGAILLAIGILVYCKESKIYKTWNGNYNLCLYAMIDSDTFVKNQSDWSLTIDISSKTVRFNNGSEKDGIWKIKSINDTTIELEGKNENNTINGKIGPNGFIYFYTDSIKTGNVIAQTIAIKSSDMEEIRSKWNGTFEMEGRELNQTPSVYSRYNGFLYAIDVDTGMVKCQYGDNDHLMAAHITYIDKDELRFVLFGSPEEVFVCKSLGSSGFEMQLPNTDTYAAVNDGAQFKCNRIFESDILPELENENTVSAE